MVVVQVEILFPKDVEAVQAIFQCMCLILYSEIAPFGQYSATCPMIYNLIHL